MTIPAKSVMSKDLVTVSPENTVIETARLMLARGISAVPVVEADNRPIGVVTEGDLMRHFGAEFQNKRAKWLRLLAEGETYSPAYLATIGLDQHRVRSVMRAPVISASEDASLAELADLMLKNGIKRVLILRADVLVGIVSRADVLRAVIENIQELLEPID